jgi:hypothetical protein
MTARVPDIDLLCLKEARQAEADLPSHGKGKGDVGR